MKQNVEWNWVLKWLKSVENWSKYFLLLSQHTAHLLSINFYYFQQESTVWISSWWDHVLDVLAGLITWTENGSMIEANSPSKTSCSEREHLEWWSGVSADGWFAQQSNNWRPIRKSFTTDSAVKRWKRIITDMSRHLRANYRLIQRIISYYYMGNHISHCWCKPS